MTTVRRVVIVPGLAVRGYARGAAAALAQAGFEVDLLAPPAWHGEPTDLRAYGRRLAHRLETDGRRLAVLVGLSVGTQAAAVAAAETDLVDHLLLVSPTVDPSRRSRGRLLAAWLKKENHPNSPTLRSQVPDWSRAGVVQIYRGFTSAIAVPLEDVLSEVSTSVAIVHAEADQLTAHAYAAGLAAQHDARLILMPDAPHSWPVGDAERFVELIEDLTA